MIDLADGLPPIDRQTAFGMRGVPDLTDEACAAFGAFQGENQ